jgi:hypothetical protein
MENKDSKISIGIMITTLPFFGYFFSFIYEYGAASYFNIPYEIISINIEGILFFTFLFCFTAILLLEVLDLFYSFILNFLGKFIILRYIIYLIVSFSIIDQILRIIVKTLPINEYNSLFILVGLFLIFFPLVKIQSKEDPANRFFRKNVKGISNNIEDSQNISIKKIYKNPNKLMDELTKRIGLYSYLIMILPALMLLTYSIGKYSAMNQNNFYTIGSDSTYVIVKIYGDKIILNDPHELKKRYIKKVKIIEQSSINNIVLIPFNLNNYAE